MGLPLLGSFYHVTLYEGLDADQTERLTTCDCSKGKGGLDCLHQQVMRHDTARFKEEITLSSEPNPVAIEIASHLHGRRAWFSVLSTRSSIQSNSQDGKRCIVSLVSSQRWTCSASHCSSNALPATSCVHRIRAQTFWQESFGPRPDSEESDENEEEQQDDLQQLSNTAESVQAHVQINSCSYLPIPPPPFCRLSSDPEPRPPTTAQALPSPLPLGDHARCDCGRRSNNTQRVLRRKCVVYYSSGPLITEIETQECTCRRSSETRSIGPDLCEYGLFNWNNAVVVSHELFNSYSSQLSASPTPFTAFCTTTQHAYAQHAPLLKTKFLARSTFVKLYFAYVRIQQLEVSFSCPQCGPHPSIVIADGIVLAYSSSLTHARLSPPTTVGPDINTNARPRTVTPFLPPVSVRRAARAFCRSLKTVDADHAQLLKTFSTNLHAALATFPGPIALWCRQYEQLLFAVCLSPSLPSSLEHALHHLIDQFCANEGVFQLCRPSIAPLLLSLSETPASQASTERYFRLGSSLARHCPFLGNVVLAFTSSASQNHHSLLVDLNLLMRATVDVINYQLGALHPRTTPSPSALSTQIDAAPYTQTGAHYGATKCRSRPTYPHLDEGRDGRSGEKHASQEQDEGSSQQCRKFYDEYVKRKRTGGLMALWCTHRLCVGFHVIPQAEGRNDVFSAIYCHWPIAPSVIVYDFACQLGPYSLRREPDYFKNTLFVVDQMHEKGHTDCSASSRLSTYMRNDPQLQHVYSSAAECGNAGLARIKKTVSYSKQEHAVALVRVFLSIWNRRRIRDAPSV